MGFQGSSRENNPEKVDRSQIVKVAEFHTGVLG